MTTDDARVGTGADEAAQAAQARIEALRQRRATSGAHRDSEAARPRRRHAAAGARILAAGLSASAALGLMGAMAGGLSSDGATDQSPTPAVPAAEPVVTVIRRSANGADLARTPAIAPAPAVQPTNAAPVTSSQGS